MDKKVILKLDGILEHGCRVVLEIWSERGTPGESSSDRHLEAIGSLPPNPQLAERAIAHWKKYRALGDPARSLPTRLNPESITYNGSFNRTRECRESARALKAGLQAWLDSTEFRPIERLLRDELHRRDRIRLQIRAEDSQLQKLPWHLWDWIEHRSVEVEFYFLPSNRSLPLPPPTEDRDRVRILAILGHSNGIDIDADCQVLESLPDADVRFLVEPKRQDLCDRFWEQPWDILFFAGHSETEGERGRIYLNPTDSLTLDELECGLRQAVKRGLQLAIFNSCDGLGLAQQLGDLQIPQIVVMRELVADRVAQAFLKYFLKAFSQGKPFELAVRQGREQLEGLEDEYPCASWLPAIVAHPQARSLRWGPGLRHPDPLPLPLPLTPPPPPSPWKTLLAASLALASVTMGVRSLGWLQTWELQAFDRLLQLQPDEPLDPRIAIVTITEADIQAQNPEARQGSLSNETLDRLLQKLDRHQARVIGLDIYRPFALDAQYRRLANEFKNNDKLIGICEVGGGTDHPPIPPSPDLPLTRIGFSDIPIDRDGIVRRQLFGMSSGKECETEVSLSFAIAQRYLEAEGIEFKFASPNSFQVGTVRFPRLQPNTGGYHQVDNGGYQVMLNYRSAGAPAQTLTLGEFLDDRFDPAWIRDRIVLIGTTATSIEDGVLTPYSAKSSPLQSLPGVFVQAHAVSQILSAVKDNRPILRSLPEWGEFLCVWVGVLVGEAIFMWGFSRQRSLVVYVGLGLGGLMMMSGMGYVALVRGVWMPIVPMGLAFTIASAKKAISSSQRSIVHPLREINIPPSADREKWESLR